MKTAAQYCLLSMAVMISFSTLNVAEVHPSPARKPDFTAEKVRCDSKWSVICLLTRRSKTLEKQGRMDIQWGEQIFDTLPIFQVFLLTKYIEVCNFYHRYTSTVRDGI